MTSTVILRPEPVPYVVVPQEGAPDIVAPGSPEQPLLDVFAFANLEAYEACLATDHLVETVRTNRGEQTRVLGPAEIQARCVEAAVKLLAGAKDQKKAIEFIEATKRGTAWEHAAALVGVAADTSLPVCNELALYEVLTHTLRRPRDPHFFPRAKRAVKKCLEDKTFRADFLDEKDAQDKVLAANACAILLEEKLVNACTAER